MWVGQGCSVVQPHDDSSAKGVCFVLVQLPEVLTQGYACGYLVVYACVIFSSSLLFCFRVVFKGFLFEPPLLRQPISPCIVFFPTRAY